MTAKFHALLIYDMTKDANLGEKKMTNFVKAILAIIIVVVVWTILGRFVAGIMGLLFTVAMLALFVGAIVYVYKMLTRQKI